MKEKNGIDREVSASYQFHKEYIKENILVKITVQTTKEANGLNIIRDFANTSHTAYMDLAHDIIDSKL